jgi:hypothetical protein
MDDEVIDDLVKLKAQHDIVTEQLVQIERSICTKLLAMRTGGLDKNLFQTYIRYYHRCLIDIDDITFDEDDDGTCNLTIKGCDDFDESQVTFFYKDKYDILYCDTHASSNSYYYMYCLNRCT